VHPGLVTDIVAQSDIAMYLRTNIALLSPSVVNATVASLNLGAQGGGALPLAHSLLYFDLERRCGVCVRVVAYTLNERTDSAGSSDGPCIAAAA
jgi:hypothetical protein